MIATGLFIGAVIAALFIGVIAGVLLASIVTAGSNADDCRECQAAALLREHAEKS